MKLHFGSGIHFAEPGAMSTSAREAGVADGGSALLRIVAIAAVVMLHMGSYFRVPATSSASGGLFSIVGGCCFWAVPAFIVLSGYHTLPRIERTGALAYYRRRIGGVVLQTLFWSALFSIVGCVQGHVVILDLAGRWLRCIPCFHLWFVFMLLGLYAMAPLCWLAAKSTAGVVAVLCLQLAVSLSPGMWDVDPWRCPILISMPYAAMFSIGGIIARRGVAPFVGRCSIVLSAAYFCFMIGMSVFGGRDMGYPIFHYLGFAGVWGGVSVTVAFLYLGRGIPDKAAAVLFHISRLVFGVYLVHPLVMTFFSKVVPSSLWGVVTVRFAIWMAVCAASFVFAALCRSLPYLRRIV